MQPPSRDLHYDLGAAVFPLQDFNLQTRHLCPMEAPAHVSSDYGIVLHLSKPTQIEWFTGNKCSQVCICPGQISLHSPGELPAFRSNREAKVLELTFSAVALKRLLGEESSCVSQRDLYGFSDVQLGRLLTLLETERQNGHPGGRLFCEGVVTALFAHLFRHPLGEQKPSPSAQCLSEREVKTVIAFVEAHLDHDLSLSTLASLTHYSVHHFALLFREATGATPHQFVTRERIEKAQSLILKSDLTLSEIALQVGFANQSHLNLHFKRLTGMTPTRFRREAPHGNFSSPF